MDKKLLNEKTLEPGQYLVHLWGSGVPESIWRPPVWALTEALYLK